MRKEDLKKVNLSKAYKGCYYTIIGAGGDLQEWLDGYEKWLTEQEIGLPANWYYATGDDVNKIYHFTGKNKFKKDLILLFFPLNGLDVSRLATFKIRAQDHWFNDIIDDKRFRQKMGI